MAAEKTIARGDQIDDAGPTIRATCSKRTLGEPGLGLSLVERVHGARAQLFKAISMAECCRYATASKLVANDSEYMIPTFEAIRDLLEATAEDLDRIAGTM